MTTANQTVAETELRHGYTLADVNKLTMIAVLRDNWHRGMDLRERQELAWSAIVECLYSQDEPPSRHTLIQAAQVAIDLHVKSERSTHGISVQNSYAKSGQNVWAEMPNFQRFWWAQAAHTQGPEERVVDRLALWQIWTRLAPRFQRVLLALATHDDHRLVGGPGVGGPGVSGRAAGGGSAPGVSRGPASGRAPPARAFAGWPP